MSLSKTALLTESTAKSQSSYTANLRTAILIIFRAKDTDSLTVYLQDAIGSVVTASTTAISIENASTTTARWTSTKTE